MLVPAVVLPPQADLAQGRWIAVDHRQQVLVVEHGFPVGPTSPVETSSTHLLGMVGEAPVWAVDPGPEPSSAAGHWVGLRSLFGVIPDADWVLAGRAAQVLLWDRDHRFCGRCGHQTDHHHSERAKECPRCGLLSFPRLSPAVITLVERDGPIGPEVLLAWGRQFPGRFFSALAGFVEPGESLEECVTREVKEEVGLDITDVRYFGSQPWPFPHSLMVGFTARYTAGEIRIQEDEIVEAGWFSPNELPPVPRGGMSIAGWLIEDWLRRLS